MGGGFRGKSVYSPRKLKETDFDKLIILSDIHYETIKGDLIYWHHIEEDKIKDQRYLLKLLMLEKYKNTEDVEIQKILQYWEKK